MKLYWKGYPSEQKHELLAEPAARCLTLFFKNNRWEVQCLGAFSHFPGNLVLAEAKQKALTWLGEQLGLLATALAELRKG